MILCVFVKKSRDEANEVEKGDFRGRNWSEGKFWKIFVLRKKKSSITA